MKHIFVNLKRFEIPRSMGGVCPVGDSQEWIRSVMKKVASFEFQVPLEITFMLPEGTAAAALQELQAAGAQHTLKVTIGCQGVHWEDVIAGGNFGAFTGLFPSKAAKALGCRWALIGHSEERRAKLELLRNFEHRIESESNLRNRAAIATNEMINREVLSALSAELNVLLCIGETGEERGHGSFEEQKPRIRQILRQQLELCLKDVGAFPKKVELAIGYEPVWAIGPGKTPPGPEYISFVSKFVKDAAQDMLGTTLDVVYGGGLKIDNAPMLAEIPSIDGGLIALTKFDHPVGFEPEELRHIVEKYINTSVSISKVSNGSGTGEKSNFAISR